MRNKWLIDKLQLYSLKTPEKEYLEIFKINEKIDVKRYMILTEFS